jgi:putative PIN family toxin of toxin-antitoxin system
MLSLRLVIDTNIVVSAALRPDGPQRTILILSLTKPANFYVSQPILDEYREVLSRPRLKISRGLQRQVLDMIANRAKLIAPVRRLNITRDPDDNIFLECADAARADYFLTGNPRHFPKFWKATKIVTPREFMELAAPHLMR